MVNGNTTIITSSSTIYRHRDNQVIFITTRLNNEDWKKIQTLLEKLVTSSAALRRFVLYC
jgi:hypothetical protein